MHDKLVVFDIEAIIDRELLPEEEGRQKFPQPPFWKPVAISFVEANITRDGPYERYEIVKCRSGGTSASNEQDLLAGFWQYFGRLAPRIVTWNGKGYDLPVLQYRAFMYGIPMHQLFRAGTKWETYKQRYAGQWHCDLMLEMSDYGNRSNMGMDAIASAMGLPGKIGGHGSEVQGMYDAGELEKIRAYCECDVLNLYALYIRWAYVTGLTDLEGHNLAMDGLSQYLSAKSHSTPHFAEFLTAWKNSSRPMPAAVSLKVPMPIHSSLAIERDEAKELNSDAR